MSLSKDILLICLRFPPTPGIGGRRWAKFAKELAARGFNIHVIAAIQVEDKPSLWTEDVQHPSIKVYDVPNPYPHLVPSSNLLQKVKNRFTLQRLLWETKGTPYDEGVYWGKAMLAKARALIQQYQIAHVIATGAPFSALYNSVALKEAFPDIQLIVDYRDPWIHAVNYGMPDLSPKRKAFEYAQEQKVLRQADLIIAPTHPNVMVGVEAIQEAKAENKVWEIPHSFDPQDIGEIPSRQSTKEQKIQMVFGGALYIGVDPQLVRLRDWMQQIKAGDPELYQRLEIDIYSKDYERGQDLLTADESALRFHAPISKQALFQKLAVADIALLLIADHNKDFKTTKFFEILAFRQPFLMLGPKGRVSDYIEENQLGIHLDNHEVDVAYFVQSIHKLREEKVRLKEMDVSHFSLAKVTDQLIHHFT
ncbi:MAG: glycosyltransferase [Bacteroidota bacterium]